MLVIQNTTLANELATIVPNDYHHKDCAVETITTLKVMARRNNNINKLQKSSEGGGDKPARI
jgi:hypothetical protein